ncbi:hypothetical protein A8L34_28155 [Bacillus sp. FJAT-27264]|uniref:hypothetical protein n=1 Tax=Paenibacillus sp. (strain DSM 101736 / FJAT-27264) TaxID=1850362 RepID=UPI000807D7C2|nr:hypothetical protein [Bacillus sp. FJAT-27264]OBZ15922.1 hypothetical protein A8L34_28155 [Bacillus sp. FJAT-27264]
MSIKERWKHEKEIEIFACEQGLFPVRTSFFYHFWSKGVSLLIGLSLLFCIALTYVFSIAAWASLIITMAVSIIVMLRFKGEIRIVTFERMKENYESTNLDEKL